MIQLIAFDADDTLWHNETIYQETKSTVIRLLAHYADAKTIDQQLDTVEMRNLKPFGYGAKAFTLSLIETAIAVSHGQVRAGEIQQIIDLGRSMLTAEMKVLDGVEKTLAGLAERGYPLMIITKGDLLDQEAKLSRSGLADYFKYVEVVSDKTVDAYRRVLERCGVSPEQFLMIGNSLKSDILPVLQIGGYALYVPYELTWSHEMKIEEEIDSPRFFEVKQVEMVPEVIDRITHSYPATPSNKSLSTGAPGLASG